MRIGRLLREHELVVRHTQKIHAFHRWPVGASQRRAEMLHLVFESVH
jgi:hypothetical protein